MISRLFGLYRKSPFWLRNILSRSTWPLRLAMLPWSRIRVGGYQMQLDFMDNAAFKYYTDRERYEAAECNAFLRSIACNPGCYVLDIGANYGPFTLAAAQLHRLGLVREIHAFEPDRRPARALQGSVRANHLEEVVRVHQVIVGEAEGTERLFVNARSSADNRTHRITSAPIQVRDSYEVPCRTIDAVLEQSGVPLNSQFIIKMDIQGNEARAFRGMRKLLAQAAGVMVFFEHFPYLTRSAGIDPEQYLSELAGLRATEFYEIGEDELQRLPSFDNFLKSALALEQKAEHRIEGPGANYVLVRGMNSGGLNPAGSTQPLTVLRAA